MYRAALFGPPTAGKSTLSHLAAAALSLPQINTGQLVRQAIARGEIAPHQVVQGQPCADTIVMRIVRQQLAKTAAGGFLLDGFPRSLSQLRFFERLPFSRNCRYILLDLDLQMVRWRFLHRMNCAHCRRADYTNTGRCSRCGRKLSRRHDATPQALAQKLQAFHAHEAPLVRYLQQRNRLLVLPVTGDASRDLSPLLQLLDQGS